ncbi:hypothetical protein ACFWCB_22570 [Streptomyces sp. NPDC060048]|uniref:hypothetical protein n=1 Tax=unclassified Streptomyces TaxID=2593676 RepID=UPI00367FD336
MTRTYATDEQYERWYMAACCRCGRRRHKAGTWPDGYVCRTCSDRAVRTRGTCPGCGQERALSGLRPGDGAPICTTCAGFSQTFDCSRCGFEGKLLGGRLCERCTLTDRLTVLLDDGTGRIRPALVPLFDLLVAMDKPRSGLAWLEMRRNQPGNASQLLRRLGLAQIPLTHGAFHQLQPRRAAAHLEELLMTCGILPAVDKYLCSFQRWFPGHLTDIADPEHVKTIRLFATWRVLPRLRARAERSHITPSIRRFAAEQISTPPPSCNGSASGTAPSRPVARPTSTPGLSRTPNTAAPRLRAFLTGPCRATAADAASPSPRWQSPGEPHSARTSASTPSVDC